MFRVVVALSALGLIVVCSTVSAQAPARLEYGYPPPPREPTPPRGIAAMIVGIGGLALGAEQLLTIPICNADFYTLEDPKFCLGRKLTTAGLALAVGIPSLLVGLRRRARYKAWRARQGVTGHVAPFGLAGLQWRLRF